jgi:hypothetical protein
MAITKCARWPATQATSPGPENMLLASTSAGWLVLPRPRATLLLLLLLLERCQVLPLSVLIPKQLGLGFNKTRVSTFALNFNKPFN